jgi:predicted TIM-barrel fold metal-dependent hydrolase
MASTVTSRSENVRARLNHPVIDCDGHTIELSPVLHDYIRQVGGQTMVDRYMKASAFRDQGGWQNMSEQKRRDNWAYCTPWWSKPARNTIDRATASLPGLLYQRMDELGMDFTVVYPTEGAFGPPRFTDEELRRASCRAINMFHADIFRQYADRMTPVAVIPCHTPREAIEEMEFAVKELGYKVVVFSLVRRPIPDVHREHPELDRYAYRLDTLGLDSEYNYDAVWEKCLELKVVPTSHASGQGWGSRRSISNYMYNHIGNFAAANEAICKSLFMSGVTRRFPDLKFAFLECGAGWACILFADMIGHWEKRGAPSIKDLDPANVDRELLLQLISEHGNAQVRAKLPEIRDFFGGEFSGVMGDYQASHELRRPAVLDDWALCQIEKAEDIRDLFEPHFYFGSEADDPTVAWAFNRKVNPLGARLRAILSSDIGHWDVTDMREVIAEAYELVEKGVLTEEDFRDFMFANAVSLYTGMNRNFFKGTRCESDVEKYLQEAAPATESSRSAVSVPTPGG